MCLKLETVAECVPRTGVLLFGEHGFVKYLNELDIFKIEISSMFIFSKLKNNLK